MVDKQVADLARAVEGVPDGATVCVGGFGDAGSPHHLLDALLEQGARHLTIIANGAGRGRTALAGLILNGRVDRLICSFPINPGGEEVRRELASGRVRLDVVPQGTLVERLRAAGAGLGGFLTPTGLGTPFESGKRVIEVGGRSYILEEPLAADVALIRADRGDRWGNLVYRLAARNFNPVMAMAARLTVAEVREVVPLGALQPDHVHTPGVFVDRLVAVDPGDGGDELAADQGADRP